MTARSSKPKSSNREPEVRLEDRMALGIKQAATALSVSERTVHEILPELPHFYIGRRVLFPKDSLQEWAREKAETRQSRADAVTAEVLQAIEDSQIE